MNINIRYNTIKIEIEFINKGIISFFGGNTFRGAIGYCLKKVICIKKKNKCDNCSLNNSCPYIYLFETKPSENTKILKKSNGVPHPFTIFLNYNYGERIEVKKDEKFSINLTLFGRANKYIPYFIYALKILGEDGIGRDTVKFTISKIFFDDKEIFNNIFNWNIKNINNLIIPIIYNNVNKINLKINLFSPLRLQKHGKILINPDLKVFFKTLLRRINNISYFHCGNELKWDYHKLISYTESVNIINDNTKIIKPKRYSTKTNNKIELRAIIGNFSIENIPKTIYPIIKAGEILHNGKSTSFGFGKYKVEKTTVFST